MDIDSITDLLALRLAEVPFHDTGPQLVAESLPAERWVPKVTTLSFVGSLVSAGDSYLSFYARLPLLRDNPGAYAVLPVVQLPSTVVRGDLPTETSLESGPNGVNWLISGELCFMSGRFTLLAQSLYQLQGSENQSQTNQISFTGCLAALVLRSDELGLYVVDKELSSRPLDEALEVTQDPHVWIEGSVCDRERLTLADVEWLDVGVRVGEKCVADLSSWVCGGGDMVSFKCRLPGGELHADKSRVLEYAGSLPLVGQIIAFDSESEVKQVFVQL